MGSEALEEKWLNQTYMELLAGKEYYQTIQQQTAASGKEALQQLGSETRINFDSYLDNLDTFSMIESKNREIDQLNLQVDTAVKLLEKIDRLLKSPYFGKLVVDFLDDEEEEAFYIGINSFTNLNDETRVYDWRSPIAELFYTNQLGLTSYTVNNGKIDVDLKLKRQFIIKENQLIKYFDTSVAIQDDVLLQSLEGELSEYMKDITTTIQKEQNEIIRDVASRVVVVNGIAGSGKTSAIMQRIAYLLYLYRKEITAENILLLSPNLKFIAYISQVLPNLGEKNPLNLTINQFVGQASHQKFTLEKEDTHFSGITQEKLSKQNQILQSQDFVNFLQVKQRESANSIQFKDIIYNGKIILSKELIAQQFQTTPIELELRERIYATKNKLNSIWERYLIKQSRSKQMLDQVLDMTEEQQYRYFGQLIDTENEIKLASYALKRLENKYASMSQAIQEYDWVDSYGFLKSMYSTFTEKMYQKNGEQITLDEAVILLIIRHLFLEKSSDAEMRFILIDEVQDYTEAQLLLLLMLFPNAEFTFVGDENQAIFNHSLSFKKMVNMIREVKLDVKEYHLLNSYRSSGKITQLFQTLADYPEEMTIVAIRQDGFEPTFIQCQDQSAYYDELRTIIRGLPSNETSAIITKTLVEADQLALILGAESEKIAILPISMAKGLEYDNVIIHEVSEENFFTERNRRILYTAVSRAMKRAYLLYTNKITTFLEQ